jgi:hypothetical protein
MKKLFYDQTSLSLPASPINLLLNPDPHQVLDFASFWNVRGQIPSYNIPAQPTSTIVQLQESLDFCAPRIRRTREAMVTINSLLYDAIYNFL